MLPRIVSGEGVAGHQGRIAKPCRDGDHGKFEVKSSDGWARLGLFHTSTHMLATPTLLPVVNPNIQTISPKEMWDIGFEALITNSYIIWKGEELKARALSEGVHELLDYPGVVMTDSGVFQQYVYGDVEIGEVEVVEFQRDIGVDIATMMDLLWMCCAFAMDLLWNDCGFALDLLWICNGFYRILDIWHMYRFTIYYLYTYS